jgi:ketosteroid isomerase-like protein
VADGKPVNVAAQLAEMKAGRVQIESITMRDMRAHVFGDVAIVSMVAESKGAYRGKPFNEKSSGIDYFVKRDGRWQLVNSQMTTIKP